MSSNQHHHRYTPSFPPFPEDVEQSASRVRTGFPVPNSLPAVIGHPIRPHVGSINDIWIFNAVGHHHRAQFLRMVIAGILRSPWWNAQTHPPPPVNITQNTSVVATNVAPAVSTGDPLDDLVEGLNYDQCVICGSNNGKTCVRFHLNYHPQ